MLPEDYSKEIQKLQNGLHSINPFKFQEDKIRKDDYGEIGLKTTLNLDSGSGSASNYSIAEMEENLSSTSKRKKYIRNILIAGAVWMFLFIIKPKIILKIKSEIVLDDKIDEDGKEQGQTQGQERVIHSIVFDKRKFFIYWIVFSSIAILVDYLIRKRRGMRQ